MAHASIANSWPWPPLQNHVLARIAAFTSWLGEHAIESLHAGAARLRRRLALCIFCQLLETFRDWVPGAGTAGAAGGQIAFTPFAASTFTPPTVAALLRLAGDSWTALRTQALHALRAMPCPLPGYERPCEVLAVLRTTMARLSGLATHEAEAGAPLLAFLTDAYSKSALRWELVLWPHAAVREQEEAADGAARPRAELRLLNACVEFLENAVAGGKIDLEAASRTCFAHGPLLLLRHVLRTVSWTQLVQHSEVRRSLGAMSSLLGRTCSCALGSTQPAEAGPNCERTRWT